MQSLIYLETFELTLCEGLKCQKSTFLTILIKPFYNKSNTIPEETAANYYVMPVFMCF